MHNGKLHVVLLADPPAGDKVKQELEKLDGIELDYRRNATLHQAVSAARPGVDWVLAMNARSAGAVIKEHARKCGARFVAIPPGWAATEGVLRQVGFIDDAKRYAGASTHLTHKPLGALVEEMQLREAQASGKLDGETHSAEPIAPKDDPRRENLTRGAEAQSKRAKEKAALVRQLLEAAPDLPVDVVQAEVIKRFGKGLDIRNLYLTRRQVRTAKGLKPSSRVRWATAQARNGSQDPAVAGRKLLNGSHLGAASLALPSTVAFKPAATAILPGSPPVSWAPAPSQPSDQLSPQALAAAELLAQVMAEEHVRYVTVALVNGEMECAWEREVTSTSSGRQRLKRG